MTHMEKKKAIQNAITIFDKIVIGDYNGTRTGLRKILLEMKANDTEEFAASQYVMRRLLFYFDLYPRSTYVGNTYLKYAPPTRVAINLWKTHLAALDYLGVTEDGRILENKEIKSFKEMGKSMISGNVTANRTSQFLNKVERVKWMHLMTELVECLQSIGDGTYYEKVRDRIYERNAILDIWIHKELNDYTSRVFRDSNNKRITEFYAFCIYVRKILREVRLIDENGMNITPNSDILSLDIDVKLPENTVSDSGAYYGTTKNMNFYFKRNSRMNAIKKEEDTERERKKLEAKKVEEDQEDRGFTQEKLDDWVDKYNKEHHLGEYQEPINNGCYVIYDFMISGQLLRNLKKFAFITTNTYKENFMIVGNCAWDHFNLRVRKLSEPWKCYEHTFGEYDVINYILSVRPRHIYIEVKEGVKLNLTKDMVKGISPVESEKAKFLPVTVDLSGGNFFQRFNDGLFELFLDDVHNWNVTEPITKEEESKESRKEITDNMRTAEYAPYVEPWKKMTLDELMECEIFYRLHNEAGLNFVAKSGVTAAYAKVLIDGVSDRNANKEEFVKLINVMTRKSDLTFTEAAAGLYISDSMLSLYVDYCIDSTRERIDNMITMLRLVDLNPSEE
jgi:hypothetical protein